MGCQGGPLWRRVEARMNGKLVVMNNQDEIVMISSVMIRNHHGGNGSILEYMDEELKRFNVSEENFATCIVDEVNAVKDGESVKGLSEALLFACGFVGSLSYETREEWHTKPTQAQALLTIDYVRASPGRNAVEGGSTNSKASPPMRAARTTRPSTASPGSPARRTAAARASVAVPKFVVIVVRRSSPTYKSSVGASAALGGASGGAAAALASVASICDLFFALFDLGLQKCVPRGFLTFVAVQGDYAR